MEHFLPSSLGCTGLRSDLARLQVSRKFQALQYTWEHRGTQIRLTKHFKLEGSSFIGNPKLASFNEPRVVYPTLFGFPPRAKQVHQPPSSFDVIPFPGFLVWMYTETYTFISFDFISFHVVMSFGIPPFIHSPYHRFI